MESCISYLPINTINFLSSFRVSFILASLITFCFITNSLLPNHYLQRHIHTGIRLHTSRSLLSFPPEVGTTTVVATLDGTVHLVEQTESGSMKVIWSFSTGPPIYESIRAPREKDNYEENACATVMTGFMDCGDDWSLYTHDEKLGKKRISQSIADIVAHTPNFSDDGAATLGTKKLTMFEVNAKTGSIIQIHVTSDSGNAKNIFSRNNTDLADAVKLQIFRKDYYLESVFPSSGIVLWTLAVAEFDAVLFCQHTKFDSGLNFAMPYPCQEKQEVFRLKTNFLFKLSLLESLLEAYYKYNIHSMCRLFNGRDDNIMLHQPLVQISTPREVYLNRTNEWSTLSPFNLFIVILLPLLLICLGVILKNKYKPKHPNSESELKSTSGAIDNREKQLSSKDEDVPTQKDTDLKQVDESVGGQKIGKIFVSSKEIATGTNGTIFLEGKYEDRVVSVKRFDKAYDEEIQNLIKSHHHPNIVRWLCVESDCNFIYLALEHCTCNLDYLIQNSAFREDQHSENSQLETRKDSAVHLWEENGDIVSGVVRLHELEIIHRDLKPHNVLITKEEFLCAKLSEMSGAGSSGWQAPEQIDPAANIFSLGCILFFCVTRGKHPFGEHNERDKKILKNKKDLCLVEFIPEAEDLISHLLNPSPHLRPKAIEVLFHPFFWSSEMRLSFLRDTSDRVEPEGSNSDLMLALERISWGRKWNEKMESAFIENIRHYQKQYDPNKVRDLIRVVRNKLNHYGELPQEIQKILGPLHDGFYNYFSSRYPSLFIDVYNVILQHCKKEEVFQRYFKNVS